MLNIDIDEWADEIIEGLNGTFNDFVDGDMLREEVASTLNQLIIKQSKQVEPEKLISYCFPVLDT